jgi:hypothetical protein
MSVGYERDYCDLCGHDFAFSEAKYHTDGGYTLCDDCVPGREEDLSRIRDLETRLEAEIKRREEAEEVIRHYGDEKNWQSPKGSLAVIIWRPKGVDHATGNLGYLLAKEYLNKYAEGE